MKTVYNADGTVMTAPQLVVFNQMLSTRQFLFANLYQFNMVDGSSNYYSGGDTDIAFNSINYSAGGTVGPYFDTDGNRAKYHCKLGTEVDTLNFDVLPGTSQVSGVDFLKACQQGIFDGSEVILSRAYWSSIGYQTPTITPSGVVANIFVGRSAEVDAGRSMASFSINSHLELLNQFMPIHLYQTNCRWTLYDSGCTLNQASFAVAGTAGTHNTAGLMAVTMAQATGYFDLGKIKFTSGANNGLWRSIKTYTLGTPGSMEFSSPFPNIPASGDTFTAYPGCDHTQATCTTKFSNVANFGGQPFVPDPSSAV